MKVLLGFVAGVVVTSAVWYQVPTNTHLNTESTTEESHTSRVEEPEANEEQIWTTERFAPKPQFSEAIELVPDPAKNIDTKNLEDPKERDPIQTSYEHDKLIKGTTPGKSISQLHEELELEALDSDWSPQMESYISEYLVEHDFVDDFSINQVVCRTTLCEIQAFGYEGHEKWNVIMQRMQTNKWFGQFARTSTSSSSKDGKTTAVTILHRKTNDD